MKMTWNISIEALWIFLCVRMTINFNYQFQSVSVLWFTEDPEFFFFKQKEGKNGAIVSFPILWFGFRFLNDAGPEYLGMGKSVINLHALHCPVLPYACTVGRANCKYEYKIQTSIIPLYTYWLPMFTFFPNHWYYHTMYTYSDPWLWLAGRIPRPLFNSTKIVLYSDF
jgi:hypothetical protein